MSQKLEWLVARDTVLCEAMADEIHDYLKSNELFWEPNRRRPGGTDLPKLTIGGLLLAMRRLETLRNHLNPDRRAALARVGQVLAFQKSQWQLRYQDKLARDLRSRLDAWDWYLDDCKQQGESAIVYYPRQVETRVKIDLLLEEARGLGLEVEKSSERATALDQRLRSVFAPGDFCWIEPLVEGFPRDRFWYLWGQPRKD